MIHSENSKKRYKRSIRNITRKIFDYEEELDDNLTNSYITSLKLGKQYYKRSYLKHLYKKKKESLKDLKEAMKFNPKYTQNQCRRKKLFIIEYNASGHKSILYSIDHWFEDKNCNKHLIRNINFISYLPKNCKEFFYSLQFLTKIPKNLDTSHVITMERMFLSCDEFNSDISNWDTSNVTNMSQMFQHCSNFNQDISKWNTFNVTNMDYMFFMCFNFNQDISKWDTSNVTSMGSMFYLCKINPNYKPRMKSK